MSPTRAKPWGAGRGRGQGKPVSGLDQRPQDGLEGVWIASAGALEQV
jgi:hypothetical protein